MYVWVFGNGIFFFYFVNEIVFIVKLVWVVNGGRKIMYVELLIDSFLNLYVKFGIFYVVFFVEIKVNWVIIFKL